MGSAANGYSRERENRMKKLTWGIIVGIVAACSLTTAQSQERAQESVDQAMISAIREEGLAHSQVFDNVSWLADVYGPRVTGSPSFKQAGDWVQKRFAEWGLANIHKENWKFGKGWSLVHFDAHMIEPQVSPLIGYPKTWTPGTKGPVTGEVVRVDIASDADFEKYRGKLAGKIVLTQPARDVKMLEGVIVQRWPESLLKEAESTPLAPLGRETVRDPSKPTLADRTQAFFAKEGVLAALDRGGDAYMVPGDNQMSWRTQHVDGGTVFVATGGPHDNDHAGKDLVPSITLAVEHYNRMVRILDKKIPVKVEVNVQAQFHDETEPNGFNVIAELPGGELSNEFVLLGAHLDSHQSATGATDNAAGSAIMMEALRILKTLGVKPRRTIRVALWGGEEEGLLGSKVYVRDHLFDEATKTPKPEYQNVSAYYNMDNGTGRIRGIWLQENLAIAPIFRTWFQSLRDLDVPGTIAPRSVSGSDYASFDEVGIPAFQFMQDRLEYNSRTHHSNMDTVDRIQRDDLVQAAIVVATFAYDTAMRPEKLPRKASRHNSARPTGEGSK
jgi:carboxypeptidase Q